MANYIFHKLKSLRTISPKYESHIHNPLSENSIRPFIADAHTNMQNVDMIR